MRFQKYIFIFIAGLIGIGFINLKTENYMLRSEVDSINKTLLHREIVAGVLIDRDFFQRYAISQSNEKIGGQTFIVHKII